MHCVRSEKFLGNISSLVSQLVSRQESKSSFFVRRGVGRLLFLFRALTAYLRTWLEATNCPHWWEATLLIVGLLVCASVWFEMTGDIPLRDLRDPACLIELVICGLQWTLVYRGGYVPKTTRDRWNPRSSQLIFYCYFTMQYCTAEWNKKQNLFSGPKCV